MTLQTLDTALKTVMSAVFHYEAFQQTGNYLVWAEDGQADATYGNNRMQVQYLTGTTDYYTQDEYDANVPKIQKSMSDAGVTWRLNSVQYEPDTKYIHWEWAWEILVDPHG